MIFDLFTLISEPVPKSQSGTLNVLLSRPGITLYEILEDEDFLNELEGNNELLIE